MADFGLSAFAMFFMQSASFLSFQRTLERGQGRSNCQTLFGIEKIPSDNYIRDMLDGADPALLAPCFKRTEELLLEPAMREAFSRLGGRTLVALDGTEYFCSQKIACPHCQTRKRSNGKIESYHSMLAATVVAPGHSKAVPLSPEFIVKQDGAEKQDCERNAVKRWLDEARRAPETLAPGISRRRSLRLPERGREVRRQRRRFPLHLQGDLAQGASHAFIDGAELEHHEVKVRKGKTRETHRYRFVEKVPLRDGKDAVMANWIGLEILDAKGAVKYKTAFVTSLPVTKAAVAEMAACGRARWKIENESFNILKNHGYELEHNFGHGENYLAMMLAALNMLAFAWHTVLDLIEPPWRKAREAAEKRTSFFAYLATLTSFAVFPAWPDLLQALATFTIPPNLLSVQKNE